jgi:gamma-glutamyltranspeptidase/glutathione hydrolase
VDAVHNLPLSPGATVVPRPGLMWLSDLAAYSAPLRAPTHVTYEGLDVYGMAPPSSGGITVGESLNILSNFDLRHMTTVQALHHYLEATRLAFADRNRYIGDPSFVTVPGQQLLSAGFGRQWACLINPAMAVTSPVPPGDPFVGPGGCVPVQPAEAGRPSDGAATNNLVVADQRQDPRRRGAGSPGRRRCRRRGSWPLSHFRVISRPFQSNTRRTRRAGRARR